jgi:HK97 family phage prohead protease
MNKESKGMDLEELFKKFGIEDKEGLKKDSDGNSIMASVTYTKDLDSDISDEEYARLCEENKMASDGSDIHDDDLKAKHIKAIEEGQIDKASVLHRNRILSIRGSDETIDKHGDLVRVDGWDVEDYKKNPVFLWGHDYSQAPVGRTVDVYKRYDDEGAPNNKSLMFKVHFPKKEVSEKADAVFKLFKSKTLNATSVGFMPTKMNNPSDEEEREQLGLGKYGVEFTSQKLWELSAVPIPSNGNALVVNSAEIKAACDLLKIEAKTMSSDKKEAHDGDNNVIHNSLSSGVSDKDIVELIDNVKELKSLMYSIVDTIKNINVGDSESKDIDPSNDSDADDSLYDIVLEGIENIDFTNKDKDNAVNAISELFSKKDK